MALPISAPPQTQVKMPPGSLFLSNTSAMTLVVARVTKGVVGAPFLHKIASTHLLLLPLKRKLMETLPKRD